MTAPLINPRTANPFDVGIMQHLGDHEDSISCLVQGARHEYAAKADYAAETRLWGTAARFTRSQMEPLKRHERRDTKGLTSGTLWRGRLWIRRPWWLTSGEEKIS